MLNRDCLIDRIYINQSEIEELNKKNEDLLSQINKNKEEIKKLETLVDEDKKDLLLQIENDDPIKVNDIIAQRFHRTNVGYTDEKELINYLKEKNYSSFIKQKITESLDKNPLKKEIKNNESFKEELKNFIINEVVDYVVVTTKENYEKILEHINK